MLPLRHSLPQAIPLFSRLETGFTWRGMLQYGGWSHGCGVLACRQMGGRSSEREAGTGPILDWLCQREDEMAAHLAELVAIPTENPPGRNYRACADVLQKRLREFGIECERVDAVDPKEDTGES